MLTKTQLRKRWTDPEFTETFEFPRDRIPAEVELQNLDLRGIPKLGNGEPLWHFAIQNSKSSGIDFSFGDGCLVVGGSKLIDTRFEEFKFDRATRFTDTILTRCDFQRARLRLNATDTHFIDCDFALSTFAGGHSEYGFTRCTFTDCSFRSGRWSGTYFKACTFESCDLTQFQIIDSVVTCIKHQNCDTFTEDMFSGGDIRTIIEIA